MSLHGIYQNLNRSIHPPTDIDIIGLLIPGVLFVVLFLAWQGHLEHIHTSLHPSGSSCLQSEVFSASSNKRDSGWRDRSIVAHTSAANEALFVAPRQR